MVSHLHTVGKVGDQELSRSFIHRDYHKFFKGVTYRHLQPVRGMATITVRTAPSIAVPYNMHYNATSCCQEYLTDGI